MDAADNPAAVAPPPPSSLMRLTWALKKPFYLLSLGGTVEEADFDRLGAKLVEILKAAEAARVVIDMREIQGLPPRCLALLKKFREKLVSMKREVRVSGANDALAQLVRAEGGFAPNELVPTAPAALKSFAPTVASRSDAPAGKAAPNAQLVIADPDATFLLAIEKDSWAARFPPRLADCGSKVLAMLSNDSIDIAAVIVHHDIKAPDAVSVIRKAHQTRPSLPVYLLGEGADCPLDDVLMARLGVSGYLAKPFSYADTIKAYIPPRELLDLEEITRHSTTDHDPVGAEVGHEDNEFTSVSARRFFSGSKCVFDVYVRVGAGKYVKVTRSGDEFSTDRLAGYVANGTSRFYIRREMQEQYIAYCDLVLEKLGRSPAQSLETRFFRSIDQGEQVLSYLQRDGKLKLERFQFAQSYMKGLFDLIKAAKITEQSALIDSFTKEAPAMDHSASVAMVAALVAREAGFQTEKSMRIVGVAAMFHDLALQGMSEAVRSEDESKMSDDEKSDYHRHPLVASNALAKIKGIDPIVLQAVSQHHMRKDGSGFPNRSGMGSQICPPAEIVSMADAYIRYVQGHGADWSAWDMEAAKRAIFRGVSMELIDAFLKVFKLDEASEK